MFGKRPLYYIPDGNGSWMLTSPEIHNGYIALKNQESCGKLRAVAQLFKFWRVWACESLWQPHDT